MYNEITNIIENLIDKLTNCSCSLDKTPPFLVKELYYYMCVKVWQIYNETFKM